MSARRQEEEKARSVVLWPTGRKRVQGSRNQGPGLQKHPWAFCWCVENLSLPSVVLYFSLLSCIIEIYFIYHGIYCANITTV